MWEYLFVLATSAFYVLSLYAPNRAVQFAPLLSTIVLTYFFVSYVCALLKESFENIGGSLYMSKWYLMRPALRKDFLKIMIMGQKTQTLRLGPLGYASLERFTQVTSNFNVFLLGICFHF